MLVVQLHFSVFGRGLLEHLFTRSILRGPDKPEYAGRPDFSVMTGSIYKVACVAEISFFIQCMHNKRKAAAGFSGTSKGIVNTVEFSYPAKIHKVEALFLLIWLIYTHSCSFTGRVCCTVGIMGENVAGNLEGRKNQRSRNESPLVSV